jgi:hypothetical protein
MWHYCDDSGTIRGGIWRLNLSGQIQSYAASTAEEPQNHPSFEAAYIALKMRIK